MISYLITLYESQLEIGQFVVCSRNILKGKRLLFHCHNSFLFCNPRYLVYILYEASSPNIRNYTIDKLGYFLLLVFIIFYIQGYQWVYMFIYVSRRFSSFKGRFSMYHFPKPFFACNQVCKRVKRKVMAKVESSSYINLTAYNAHCQKM